MNPRSWKRPSPALIVSIIALVIAMGGTGYAALALPKNSVGAKQIRRNAVTSAKIKNGSLLSRDFKAGQLSVATAGTQGATGERGPKGDKGDKGAPGPSNAYYAHNAAIDGLPPGDYVVIAQVEADNTAHGTPAAFSGYIFANGTSSVPESHGVAPAGSKMTIPVQAIVHLPSGGNIPILISSVAGVNVTYDLTAIRVGTAAP